MFGSESAPVATRTNLFGEIKKENEGLNDIQDWLKANPQIKTAPGRIQFIMNGVKVNSIALPEVTKIGEFTVGESTMASECIEKIVTEFANLKPYLDEPKSSLRRAVELIEKETKPKGFLGLIGWKSSPALTPEELRKEVKGWVDSAVSKMTNCVTYRLNPFIDGLNDAIYYVDGFAKNIDDAINTLDYVNQRSQDGLVKDLALRRKEMFNKSAVLMQLNKGQLQQMNVVCEKNKAFLTELTMTIVPVIENVMRSAVIGDVGNDGLGDIANKMKGLL